MYAIYSDFSDQADGICRAKEALDELKQAATAEQFTDFDPSGSSGDAAQSSASKQGSDDVDSSAETCTTQTSTTDCTSLSNDVASLGLGGSTPGSRGRSASSLEESLAGGYFKDTEKFDTATKELLLAETFPSLRPERVAYTLKKCGGDYSKATDELLNHVYFEASRSSPADDAAFAKGVEGFSEQHHVPHRGKKGKRRKQKASPSYDGSPASTSESDRGPTPAVNRWADGGRNIEFIAARTKYSTATVASVYHENGASLAATITALMKKDMMEHAKDPEPDAALIDPAVELNAEFPNVDLEHAVALARITAPSTANAHELAKALTAPPVSGLGPRGGIHVIPRYAPVDLSTTPPDAVNLPSLPASATARTTTSVAAARGLAFDQASAAYRKGKSNHLMKAAAGYYSQLGRDLTANLHAMNEADADLLVASQSTATTLDLHGVSVQSAVRIAREKTETWWDALGEQRIPGGGRRGAGDGYRIITGLGRHSEGGRGKLGPAVVRALLKDGWKVEVGSGELVVMGVARRK